MKKTVEELLRKTGDFKEEDIKESAEIVEKFVEGSQIMLECFKNLPPISKLLGLKEK